MASMSRGVPCLEADGNDAGADTVHEQLVRGIYRASTPPGGEARTARAGTVCTHAARHEDGLYDDEMR